jgi:hydroxymethylpyrimidine pyrophosphatase-like HAD family hydrolase
VSRRYDLIAIDLDGTLLDSKHRISAANLLAIERARGAGYLVTVCTGRGWVECREYAKKIGQTEPAVVAGGAIVTCAKTERTLHRFPLDQELAAEMTRCMLEHGHAVLVLKDPDATGLSPGERGHDYVVVSPRGEGAIDPVSRWWFKQMNVSVKIVPDLSHDEHPEHTVRVGICGPRRETNRAAEEIRERFGTRVQLHHFGAVAPTSDTRDPDGQILIFEAFGREVNKWTAIQWLAGRERIDESRVVAIGNDINDVAMLEGAGLSIAVENAIPEALAAAKRRTRSNEQDGVAHAIEQVLNGEW